MFEVRYNTKWMEGRELIGRFTNINDAVIAAIQEGVSFNISSAIKKLKEGKNDPVIVDAGGSAGGERLCIIIQQVADTPEKEAENLRGAVEESNERLERLEGQKHPQRMRNRS